jgi:SAM-dependent methyltransferase
MTDHDSALLEAHRQYEGARTAQRNGDRKGALAGALMALGLAPQVPAYRQLALSVLATATGYKTLPSLVMDALRHCIADPQLDAQSLALVVKTIIEADPRLKTIESTLGESPEVLEHAIAAGQWNWLLDEPLLIGVLSRATNISIRIEDVLCALRRHVTLLASRQQSSALLLHPALMCAMVLQLNTSRFAWALTPGDSDALNSTQEPMVHALHLQLDQLPSGIVKSLPEVLQAKRNSILALRDHAARFPALTPIIDHTSAIVGQQYERFPYPPWDGLMSVEPTTLDAFLALRFPGRSVPDHAPRILSAGCGTGRGALLLGLMFPAANITAMDLSRTSLAYAAMKAEQLNVANIRFGVGDILNVAALNQRFDLIESSGVVHHMADPAAGLRALRNVLNPGGVMRIALYSTRGRRAVIAARDVLRVQSIADTDAGVREARQVLRALPASHPARGTVDTPEFFTIDGLHDLIFNVQETRYTPAQLQALLYVSNLEFLGFDFEDGQTLADFKRIHPNPSDALDLAAWEDYEQAHPGAFAEMYQFWCAPRL